MQKAQLKHWSLGKVLICVAGDVFFLYFLSTDNLLNYRVALLLRVECIPTMTHQHALNVNTVYDALSKHCCFINPIHFIFS